MKDPAFLFYPNDWVGGTMGMTFEEKGAYMELLMMQFNRGHMTTHMIGQAVGQLWDNVREKFVKDDDGLWYNERLEIEKEKRKRFTESRRNNVSGKNQYTKKASKKGSGHMTSHMENENKDNINIVFDVFWSLYNKKVGDKSACEKKWNNLKDTDRQKIIDTLPSFINTIEDKQYQPHPSSYLNQRRWEDELPLIAQQIKLGDTPWRK